MCFGTYRYEPDTHFFPCGSYMATPSTRALAIHQGGLYDGGVTPLDISWRQDDTCEPNTYILGTASEGPWGTYTEAQVVDAVEATDEISDYTERFQAIADRLA